MLCVDPTKQLQTWLERAAPEQQLIHLIEVRPPQPPPHQPSQLSSINSFHAGRWPEILHIPQWSYLKFISNKWSIKGNVCSVTATSLSWGDADHNRPLLLIMDTAQGGCALEFFWALRKWNTRATHSTGVIIHRPQSHGSSGMVGLGVLKGLRQLVLWGSKPMPPKNNWDLDPPP